MSSTDKPVGGTGTARRLVWNTGVNGVANVSGSLLTLLLMPFLLHRLGAERFGIWLLASSLTFTSGYLALADLGLSEAAVRAIAAARARGDRVAVGEITATLLTFFAVVGMTGGILGIALSRALVRLFDVPEPLRHLALAAFVIVAVQVTIDLPVAALSAAIEGADAYLALRLVDTGGRLLFAMLAVAAVLRGGGPVALAWCSLAASGLAAVVALVLARRVEPALRLSPGAARLRRLREISHVGGPILVMRTLGVIYRQMDRVIIAVALTVAAVAQYEVALKVHATATQAMTVCASALVPATAHLAAASSPERIRSLYLRGTRLTVAVCVPVTVVVMVLARDLLRGWVGDEYTSMTGATRLFLVYPCMVAVHVVGLAMLVGLGRVRELLVANIVALSTNLALSIVLVPRVGINGVIWGTLAGYAVIWVPYVRLFLRAFDVALRTWIHNAVAALPGVAASLVAAFAVSPWTGATDNLVVIGALAVVAMGAGIATSLVCSRSSFAGIRRSTA